MTEVYHDIKKHWDSISKPIDGLGDFEDVICRIGDIKGTPDFSLDKKVAVIMCADNGIVSEGVSQTDREVTAKVAAMIGRGISTSNTLSKAVGARCMGVDVGIDTDSAIEGIKNVKIRRGTKNFLTANAMSEREVSLAIDAGIETVRELSEQNTDIIACGEMGIGNTTTAAALISLLLDKEPEEVVGRGAGLSDDGLKRKTGVVKKAKERYLNISDDDAKKNALLRLSQVGGLDIAAMCGLYIGGLRYHIPIVIDGMISAAAALCASFIEPDCKTVMIASHEGRESGTMMILNELSLTPLIRGNMALGEGTGAIMLFPLLDAALYLYKNGSVFSEGDIEEYRRFI